MLKPASTEITFQIKDLSTFKAQALEWAAIYSPVACLDNNQYELDGDLEWMLGVGSTDFIKTNADSAFELLKTFWDKDPRWLMGYLSYDLKNEILAPNWEPLLSSANDDRIQAPELHWFEPEHLLLIYKAAGTYTLRILSEQSEDIFTHIEQIKLSQFSLPRHVVVQLRTNKTDYLKHVKAIQNDIVDGAYYELNYCQEFYAEGVDLDPYKGFTALNLINPAPFSCFYKNDNIYLLSASPERFLKKQGQRLISQPMKGTIKRSEDKVEDKALKQRLSDSEKDRAENVMIVDLVRSDLSKSCKVGSVKAEELFGIQSFPQVHQMVSTVSGELAPEVHFVDAIKEAFPMGSMTGAPKIRAMKAIEEYEQVRRGLFSGAVGYITPQGDFDLSVLIRSLVYNQEDRYLSCQTGGAITFDSDPEAEYQESLLKAEVMFKLLNAYPQIA